MVFDIVSREEELSFLHAFIDEVRDGPAALVLEGEAGIGKSTLWFAGVDQRGRGDSAFSRRDRSRPSAASLMWGSEIYSRKFSATSCLRYPRRGGARSRPRSFSR